MLDILAVLLDLVGHQYAGNTGPDGEDFDLAVLERIVCDIRNLVFATTLSITAVASVVASTIGVAVGGNRCDIWSHGACQIYIYIKKKILVYSQMKKIYCGQGIYRTGYFEGRLIIYIRKRRGNSNIFGQSGVPIARSESWCVEETTVTT